MFGGGGLDDLVARLRLDTTDFDSGVGRVEGTLGRVGGAIGGLVKTGALALGAAGVAAGGFGLKTAASMEQAQIAFETMLGSADAAGVFLKDLQKFAAKTPFEFPELQTAASSLVSVGISADKVIPIMTSLGNATSGMGTGSEGVKRATVALQQMSAAGRITGEDLNQLRDAGIPVFDLLAAATGKSKEEVAQLAQTGKLGKKEMEQLFSALETGKGLERFSGLMDKQSTSLSGLFSTLKDNVTMSLSTMVTPAIPAIKRGLEGAGSAIQQLMGGITGNVESMDQSARPKLELFGLGLRALGQAFRDPDVTSDGFVGSMERVGVALRRAADFIRSDVVPALRDFGGWAQEHVVPALESLGRFVVGSVIPALSSLWKFTRDNILPVLQGVATFVADKVVPALSDLGGKVLTGLRDAFDKISQKIEENRPQLEQLLGAFRDVWGFIADNVVPIVGTVLREALERAGDTIGKLITGVGWMVDAFNKVSPALGNLVGFAAQAFSLFLRGALGAFDGIISGAAKALGWVPGLGDKLKDANKAFDAFKSEALGSLDAVAQAAYGLGKNTAQGYAAGLADRQAVASVAGNASNLGKVASTALKRNLESNSPSKLFARIGVDTGKGYGIGLVDSVRYVTAAVGRISDAATSGLTGLTVPASLTPTVTAARAVTGTGSAAASSGPLYSFGDVVLQGTQATPEELMREVGWHARMASMGA